MPHERVIYQPQVHDRHPTMEQRIYLLSWAAARAYEAWSRRDEQGNPMVMGKDENLDNTMKSLYRELSNTDIFMGGYVAGWEAGSEK